MQFHKVFMTITASVAAVISTVWQAGAVYADRHARVEQLQQDSIVRQSSLQIIPDMAMAVPDSVLLDSTVADTLSAGADSLSAPDSLSVTDSLFRPDTTVKSGMLDQPAFSTAVDSIVEDFSSGRKMIYYYGDASVTYGDMTLKAEYMQYDVDRQVVYAAGVADTAGVVTGKPEMTQAGKTYSMDNVFYNFKTSKARIKNMVTSETDGVMRGENLNMMPDRSINISGGKYSVCDLDHPHFYLRMTKAKVETEPKQKTVFGPAYLVLADVPLYPLMLPFGFVPKQKDRASGILFPNFGEEAARGLFIKDGGFYLVLGDYFDVALTGTIFTKGSWSVNMSTRYKWRYKMNGTFTQDPKARPGTSFRASVNFSSPANNKYNYNNVNDALNSQTSSSISYSRTWSALSVSVNALHSQNSRDSSYAITFPNITLNVNRFYPFKRKNRVGGEKWYEQFALSYSTTLQNKINFKASEVRDPDFWDKMQTGMTHNFSIGLPTFTLLKYITLAPSVSYGMNWYFSSQNQYYNPETDRVETTRTGLFEDFGISQNFSASAALSTRLYGMFNFRRGKLKAIRHMVSPSISVNYAPEMGTAMNGYRVYNYTDIHGEQHTVEYNKWSGGLYSPPSPGETASISFQLGNNVEAKVVDRKDTTGTGLKKIKLIDNLNLSGSYNFLADSMKLSNISVNMTTNVLEKVSVSAGMTLDPYAVDYRGQRYNQFNVIATGRLARLTNANVSLSFSLSGEGAGKGNDGSGGGLSGGGGNRGGASAGVFDGGGGGGVRMSGESPAYTRVFYHPVTGRTSTVMISLSSGTIILRHLI